ncbi:Abi family protein [Entomospira entomophila]|uniref:Abi family protein n=1 Tax=Entomospira entomophila TaxID=2719988 RepID=A0A968GC68_9SPIO|nr:Abi family protein [Entomospira entomophilus]NIZ40928.1 Abi family protein [Entomospira entomophilus]WDI35141.1 Abi family protein [Entomospira entomophilus]
MKKPFFSYEEQRKQLEARGLIIADDDLFILQNHSYYALINVYKHPFLEPNASQEKHTTGATLKALYALAQFDNLLRSIYLRHLLLLEQHIKSMIAYEFAHYLQKNYPSHSNENNKYLDETLYKKIILDENFKKIDHLMQNMNEVLSKFQKIITKNPYRTTQITHYTDKYKFVPLWVAINELSFGDMSKFYTILPTTVKRKIVKRLIDPAMKEKDFSFR